MKKLLSHELMLVFSLIVTFILFSFVAMAQAQELEPAAVQNQNQERALDEVNGEAREDGLGQKEARVQERTEQNEERRTMLNERTQDRIINLVANVVMRLESAIGRFDNIIERLDSRIEKLEDMAVDTKTGALKLDEAKQKLSDVQTGLEDMSSVRDAVTTDAPREAFNVVKTEVKSVRDALRAVHADLREVVVLLKTAVREAELGRGVSDAVSERAESLRSDDSEDAEDMRSGADPEKYLPVSN